jgi:katanin p80 WD40 repeat-containing subunit B1
MKINGQCLIKTCILLYDGMQTTGVRSMVFNPDGRTILSATHDSLKIFSWEPLRCHDVVDVGWHKLADLCIHEGKLLGCSYNQSCVGVWVVDLLVCHH